MVQCLLRKSLQKIILSLVTANVQRCCRLVHALSPDVLWHISCKNIDNGSVCRPNRNDRTSRAVSLGCALYRLHARKIASCERSQICVWRYRIWTLCHIRDTFYARKQNASRVLAIVWASVRPSVYLSACLFVRPSVTLVIGIKTVQARITKLLLLAAPMTLVYRDNISCHWVQGIFSNEGVK